MPQVKPKKALGQHFLTDMSIARRIAATLDDYKGVPVLEIGPGMGVLTKPLLDAGHNVTVVEIDSESVAYLRENVSALDGHIVEGDFLHLDLAQLFDQKDFCIIGNYPYNISSQIFFKVLDYKDHIICCSGMLQREVAERIAAAPGSKARGILSVLLQAWYDVEYLFTVSESVFNPPPKVKSGVLVMKRNSVSDLGCDERLFKSVVKATFGQRRKTIRNSIKSLVDTAKTDKNIDSSPLLAMRPEQLSVNQFIELTNLLDSTKK